jgi:hypothetical protein
MTLLRFCAFGFDRWLDEGVKDLSEFSPAYLGVDAHIRLPYYGYFIISVFLGYVAIHFNSIEMNGQVLYLKVIVQRRTRFDCQGPITAVYRN